MSKKFLMGPSHPSAKCNWNVYLTLQLPKLVLNKVIFYIFKTRNFKLNFSLKNNILSENNTLPKQTFLNKAFLLCVVGGVTMPVRLLLWSLSSKGSSPFWSRSVPGVGGVESRPDDNIVSIFGADWLLRLKDDIGEIIGRYWGWTDDNSHLRTIITAINLCHDM